MDTKNELIKVAGEGLFDRVVAILDQARTNVVQSVNSNMVLAYWLIGREIVEELQEGGKRAEYGKQVIEKLSKRLTNKFGKGFSAPTLWNFRQFYQTYSLREPAILSPPGRESTSIPELLATNSQTILSLPGRELTVTDAKAFNPNLSWSHYRAMMRVSNPDARDFYEKEASECGWNKAQLERQIQSSYYERILDNQGVKGLLPANRERLSGETVPPEQILKSPYILEFLNLPDSPNLHENELEQAIINNLQSFLLELGKGFSFVARQKQIRFDDDDFYIDLVFYNFVLKCFLLIDLLCGRPHKRSCVALIIMWRKQYSPSSLLLNRRFYTT